MTVGDAREIVVSYLVGTRRVLRAELEEAHRLLAAATTAPLKHLGIGLGTTSEMISDCAVFRSRAAEFCDSTAAQREAESPSLLRHAEICPDCQAIYWEIQSHWRSRETSRKVLAEALHVLLAAGERLIERGLCVPPVKETFVAVTASEYGKPTRKKWLLKDHEQSCAIGVELYVVEGEVNLVCTVQPEGRWRLEIVDFRKRRVFAADIDESASSPIRLVVGSWTVRVHISAQAEAVWEIPLEIEQGDSET